MGSDFSSERDRKLSENEMEFRLKKTGKQKSGPEFVQEQYDHDRDRKK